MNVSKKFLLTVLTVGFLILNGMEEGDSPFQNELNNVNSLCPEKKRKEDVRIEQIEPVEQPKLLNLKITMARNILKSINSKIFSWNELNVLPSELVNYVLYFHMADIYTSNSLIKDADKETFLKFSKLIGECRFLFYELIDEHSQYLENFILALDEFFDSELIDEDDDGYIHKLSQKADFIEDLIEPFHVLKLFLSIMLDIKNIKQMVSNFLAEPYHQDFYKDQLSKLNLNCEDSEKLLYYFMRKSVSEHLGSSLNFFCSLNLLSRENSLKLFKMASKKNCARTLEILNENINITKEEFEPMLIGKNNILIQAAANDEYELDSMLEELEDEILENSPAAYLCNLIKKFDLPLVEIISGKYLGST